jgi:tetratricopeptide (TPR) repeat protein
MPLRAGIYVGVLILCAGATLADDLRAEANSALERGDYGAAEILYRKLLKASSNDPGLLDGLAAATHFEGKTSETIAIVERRLKIQEAPGALALAAANFCRLGEYKPALNTFERLKRFPVSLPQLALVAPCSLSAGEPLDSVVIYQQLVAGQEEPRDEFAVGLARAYIQASGRLLKQLRSSPHSEAYLAALDSAQTGASPDARGAFRQALPQVPGLNLDLPPSQFQQTLRRHPGNPAVLYVLGALCGERGMQAFLRAKDAYPSSPYPGLFQADMYVSTGQFDQAVDVYKTIIRNFPATPGVHFQLAGLYRARKEYEAALREYRQQLQLTPNDERVREGISGCLRELRNYEELYQFLQPLVKEEFCPEWAWVDFGMAAVTLHLNPRLSRVCFQTVLRFPYNLHRP